MSRLPENGYGIPGAHPGAQGPAQTPGPAPGSPEPVPGPPGSPGPGTQESTDVGLESTRRPMNLIFGLPCLALAPNGPTTREFRFFFTPQG
jgi:hypothetical protein